MPRCETTKDYAFALLVLVVFGSLACVSKIYITQPGLSWTATIICAGLSLFGLVMIQGRRVVVKTTDGSVAYPVNDLYEEAEGFVISVRQQLRLLGQDQRQSDSA